MKSVYKYQLPLQDRTVEVLIPVGSKVLAVQMQNGIITLWAEVDPTRPTGTRAFKLVGTGHPVPDDAIEYVGTVQSHGFVWHVYSMPTEMDRLINHKVT